MYESIRQQEMRASAACSARYDASEFGGFEGNPFFFFLKFDILPQWPTSRKFSDMQISPRIKDDDYALRPIPTFLALSASKNAYFIEFLGAVLMLFLQLSKIATMQTLQLVD
jgi:hypothetical protein